MAYYNFQCNLDQQIIRFLPQTARNITWIKDGQKKTHEEYERIIQVGKLNIISDKYSQYIFQTQIWFGKCNYMIIKG